MNVDKIPRPSVGARFIAPTADYGDEQFNPAMNVGADLSRPQPIHRLSLDVPISRLFC
jgi:hypothetical protein